MKQMIKYTKTTCIDIEDEFCSLDCVHLTFWCNLFQVNLTKEGKKIKRCKKCLEAEKSNTVSNETKDELKKMLFGIFEAGFHQKECDLAPIIDKIIIMCK